MTKSKNITCPFCKVDTVTMYTFFEEVESCPRCRRTMLHNQWSELLIKYGDRK